MTLREAAAYGAEQIRQAGIENPARDAEMLLLYTTGLSRIDLITRPDRILTVGEKSRYLEAIARRKLSEPVQYITGEREFYGLRFTVAPKPSTSSKPHWNGFQWTRQCASPT
jgi:release factor glutamine methyltransferase